MHLLVALMFVLGPQIVEGNAPGLQVPLQLRLRFLARIPVPEREVRRRVVRNVVLMALLSLYCITQSHWSLFLFLFFFSLPSYLLSSKGAMDLPEATRSNSVRMNKLFSKVASGSGRSARYSLYLRFWMVWMC